MFFILKRIRNLGNAAFHVYLEIISIHGIHGKLLGRADPAGDLRQSHRHGIIFFSISLEGRFVLGALPGKRYFLAACRRGLIDAGQLICRAVE